MAGAVIGIVKSAQGVVDVRSANGQIRSLLVGDSLREGDTVLTTGGGRLVIALNEGGELVMGPGEVVVMTAELSADRHPGADESQVASVDSILAALNEGRDLSTLLEPTAAGPAGGPGTNEGHTFVQLLRIVEPVGAVNSATTAGLQNQAPEIEPIYPIDFNSNPDAVDDSGETQEGVPVTITVLTNDTDPENDPLTVTNVQLLNNAPGTVTLNPDQTVTYNPGSAFNNLGQGETATVQISYTISDGNGGSDTAIITVTINGLNDPPTVVVDTGNPGGANDVSNESGLPAGSGNDPTNIEAGGTFQVADPDGVDEIVSVTINYTDAGGQPASVTIPIGVLGTSDPLNVIQTNAGQLTITGYNSTTGVATYEYVLTTATTDVPDVTETDVFTVTTTDGVATSAPATITIEIIDDVPVAQNDADSVTEDAPGPAVGNVVTGAGGDNDDGADTVGADGVQSVTWANSQNGGTVVIGQHGVLTVGADGSYSYALNNEDPAVQALDEGDSLIETFSYTLTDGDGDSSTAVLTVTINGAEDSASVVTAAAGSAPDATVYESGLNPDGSDAGATTETVTGSFTVSATDGIANVVIGGTVFTLAEVQAFNGTQTVNTGQGVLTLTSYVGSASSGTINYSYTLSATIDNDSVVPTGNDAVTAAHFDDSVVLTVNGAGGTTGSDNLVIRAIDDVPTAVDDGPASITEDGAPSVGGNVLTNDTAGADGVQSVTWANVQDGGTVVVGAHGVLYVSADGGYTYELNNADLEVQALNQGETLTETFTYTLTDGDNDSDTAVLTVTINGSNDSASVVTAAATGPDGTVYESGLNPNGSNAGATTETTTGTFTVSASDGISTVVIGGTVFTLAQVVAFDGSQTVNTGQGVLTLTGYSGTANSGTISYSYTLSATIDNDGITPTGDDAVTAAHFDDSVELTVNGASGSTGSDDLVIRAIDDVPTAVADGPVGVVEDGASNISGNVLTNDVSGADTPAAFVSWGADTAAIASLNTYGTLVQNSNGTWSFVLDNSRPATQALTSASNLSFTLNYTMKDADGDTSSSTLTITITGSNDGASVVTQAAGTAPDATVYESGLNPNGSNAGATTETVTGSFTVSATDGIANVVIGGTVFTLAQVQAFNGSQTVNTGQGVLTLTGYSGTANSGTISYSYTLSATIDNDSVVPTGNDVNTATHFDDSVVLTVNGTGGTTGSDNLVIRAIDDVPTAVADGPVGVVEDGASNISGNVLTNDVSGADTPAAFVSWGADTAAIASLNTYGTLVQNSNGTWSFVLDNSRPATQALTSASNLSFTLNYTMKDADGDTSSSTLTITITGANDGASVVTQAAGTAPDATVYESGLNPNGSNAGATTETTTGTFTVSASDGISNVVIGGTVFTLAQVQAFNGTQTVNTGQGVLTLTGYSGTANSGTISYSYTLSATIDNDSVVPTGNDVNTATHFDDSVVLTVNGAGGSTGSDNLVIRAIDDVPTAVADGPVGVVEDGVSNISGNVLTNDTSGADAPTSFVSWGADAAAIAALNTYGTLVQNANGTWSFVLDNSRPATQALTSTFNQNFTLNYTMKDADGDTSSSTLTINIRGANDGVTVTGIGNAAGDETVYENDLPNGSSPNNAALTQTGTFSITAVDGISTVQVGGTSISFAQLAASGTTPILIDTPYGALTITGYSGNAQGGTVSYSYKLDTKVDNDSQAGATGTSFVETLAVTVTDSDGSTGNSSLNIAIVDDAPYFTHVNDSNDGIVSLSALNPATDTTYVGQFADWKFGADGFGDVSASGTNVQVASSSSSQIVLNLMSGTDVVATLTLNADGTDSLEVLHRDGQVVFTPIAATSATPGGPAGSLLVDLAAATEFNILVTGDDGVAPVGSATDTVNTSTQGWAVKGGSGQSNDPGESILFSFVDDGNNTTGYGVGDFKFRTQGFTGGMNSAQISVIVYLSADMTSFDVVTLNATDNQLIQISQLDWSANAGTGSYEPGDDIYGVKVVASATNTGGFRINGVEVGAESTTPPPDLDFNNVTVSITDADGDVATQTFNIHIDGDTGNALTVEAIAGTSANDVVVGTAANDVLIGGSGHDTLTGAGGSDTFVWRLADKGAAGAPAVDTVTDFGTGGTDKLDLRDLLQGENKADLSNLDNYLHFTQAGGTTTVHISSSGGFAGGFNAGAVDQQITLTNVDLTNAGSLGSDQAIINNLLTNGKLVTD